MASNNSTCSCNVKNNLRSMIGYRYDSDHDFYEQLKKAIYYDGETYIGVCKRLIELIGSGCCHGKVYVNADREAAADWVDDFRDEVAGMLGIACNGMVDDVQDAIDSELHKRLMPPGMEWPRFDDGERVEFGSAVDGLGGPCEKFIFTRSMGGVCQLQDAGGRMVNVLHGGRVKRQKPEVLGADGLPIKIGDTVYLESFGSPFTVVGFDGAYLNGADGGYLRSACATHTPPDTQERIDKDAIMDAGKYVAGHPEAAGMREPPGSLSAKQAMMADLLCRQRELDARTMGGDAS